MANLRDDKVRDSVSDYYGKVLKTTNDFKTNACSLSVRPAKWLQQPLSYIHKDVMDKFFGCGYPFTEGLDGCTVVDLGCGAGRDVYVLSQLVGQHGHVHGVDMTHEQLDVANSTKEWHMEKFFGSKDKSNVSFHQGFIEDLNMFSNDSIDVVVSNCVVNLSPNKDKVLMEIFRILKKGGEFYFSDMYKDRRLTTKLSNDPLLHAEGLGGSLYIRDFIHLAQDIGFKDPRVVTSSPICILDDDVQQRVGQTKYFSITYRLYKIPDMDTEQEDYGHKATYLGGLESNPCPFVLDESHYFELNRPQRVSSNTAAMLTETRLSKYFRVDGDKKKHFGKFTL